MKTNPNLTAEPQAQSGCLQRSVGRLRLSIQPTYDHRKTGDRYCVSSWVGDRKVADRVPIRDPFVRHTVHVHWWDALKSLLRSGRVSVRVTVDGDTDIVDDVMELDADYLVRNSTRRAEFRAGIEGALAKLAEWDGETDE